MALIETQPYNGGDDMDMLGMFIFGAIFGALAYKFYSDESDNDKGCPA